MNASKSIERSIAPSPGWLTVCGEPDRAREQTLYDKVQRRIAEGEFSQDNQAYIRDVSLAVSSGGAFSVSGQRAEILRRLCALHSVTFQPRVISSHRPIVGRCIVLGKKLVFRLIKPLLDPMIRQQNAFNAAAVALLADLANEARGKENERE